VPPYHGHGGGRSQSEGNRHMSRYARPQIVVAVVVMSLSLWLRLTAALAIDVGDQTPDFLMHSTVGETVQLSAFRGKKNVLLFFFPAAFTSV
jgi:AhpC/TSA family